MHSDSGNDKSSGDIADNSSCMQPAEIAHATSGRPLVNHSRMQEAETTYATSGQPLTHASSIRPSNLVDSRLYIQQQKTVHVAMVVVVVMVAIAILVVIVIAAHCRSSNLFCVIKLQSRVHAYTIIISSACIPPPKERCTHIV